MKQNHIILQCQPENSDSRCVKASLDNIICIILYFVYVLYENQ